MMVPSRKRRRFLIAAGAVLAVIALALLILLGVSESRFKNFSSSVGYGPLAASIVLGAFVSQGGRTQKFNILSDSSIPALYPGDRVVAYHINADMVARGDLVIVKHPQRPGVDFVQRIIGLPGEQVQVRNGEVLINGRALQRSPVEGDRTGAIANARYYLETTPEGRGYKILDLNENSPLDNTPLQTVPQGYYWSLGNNRDNAIDSRMTAQFGLVPAANIYRKPVVIFWSKDRSRIGRKVE